MLRPLAIASLASLCLSFVSGCASPSSAKAPKTAHANRGAAPAAQPKRVVKSEEEYLLIKNELDAFSEEDPQRAEMRAALETYQRGRMKRALELFRDEEAIDGLRATLGLYLPRELDQQKWDPELVQLAVALG